jgi:hypothetical protein
VKTPIAVALIVMGGLLILAPAISDYFYSRAAASLLTTTGLTSGLAGQMSDDSRLVYWAAGAVMIAVAVLGPPKMCCPSTEKKP